MDVPEAARSRGAQVGPALRRLVVTPTFAAGLGVVVAAGLGVSMTARTVLHFTGPDQQKYCTLRGCAKAPGNPGGGGTLASAKPGIRLLPATSGPSGSSRPRSTSSGGRGTGHVAGSPVVIDYQTTQEWPGGFDGQIVISGIPASVRGTWRLAFDYPGTSIVEVQGAQWEPTGQDSGVAEAGTSSGSGAPSGGASQNGTSSSGASSKATSGATTSGATSGGASPSGTSPSGTSQNKPDVSDGIMSGSGRQSADHSSQPSTVVITIEAAGPPSAPSGCRFNDAACSFR